LYEGVTAYRMIKKISHPVQSARRHMKRTITRREYGLAYENGRRQTVNFLLSKGLREDEAQEKAQAAWAKGWERRFQLKDKEKTLSWVNTIAFNLYRSSIRKDSLHGPIREIAVSPDVSISALDLEKMLNRCRQNEHEILMLRYLRGIDITDLADRYNCTETAVRVRLLRARRSLKAKFG
jgi:DNA-directed RNA polymerase specialized sigma24 family protein